MKFWSLFTNVLVLSLARADDDTDTVVRWSSTGGGWRAMFACVGFANVFQQAGLMSEDSSLFSAIATNSGASWFLVQLFYSQAFYDQTVMAESPEDLYNFTMQWMGTYEAFALEVVPNGTDINEALGIDLAALHTGTEREQFEYNVVTQLSEFWGLYYNSNASWAHFVDTMLSRATDELGHKGVFADIQANPENRIPALQSTDMLIQSTLAPGSKIRLGPHRGTGTTTTEEELSEEFEFEFEDEYYDPAEKWNYLKPLFGDIDNQDLMVYLGPLVQEGEENATNWALYSVGISTAYIVNDTFAGFQYSTFDSPSSTELATYVSPTSRFWKWNDWESYYLWPNEGFWTLPTPNATARIDQDLVEQYKSQAVNMTSTGTLAPPFGGGAASVIQAASISSAAAGPLSPAAPTLFAQALSLQRQKVRDGLETDTDLAAVAGLTAYDLAAGDIYKNGVFDDFSVCSQWPNPCGPADGQFLDGAFSDNPSVAINVAQYHQTGGDLSKTMKLVLTNTNQDLVPGSYDTDQILQYFDCSFNHDVSPGDYVWLPGFVVPYRSPQIFEETLTVGDFIIAVQPMEDSNMSTAILYGTTIDNAAFGVQAGQSVEILVINTNTPITTFIAGATIIEMQMEPLAAMVQDIASSQELVARVKDFLGILEENENGEEISRSKAGEAENVDKPDSGEEPNVGMTLRSTSDAGTSRALCPLWAVGLLCSGYLLLV
ncbi:expressed unknown protein [Seminavis robusta]|uniref:Uncharacterized protein n=1 Tax=Seminavis robusta TaxID=568900 RepID=A0A9N8EPL6_9STRA|nr:expressed unknown protein [Seminavis robusta]|eukprot:Sro1350_g265150.1 n/a (717) ;mRNA; r:25294-27545